jgi:hypothetical protein
MPRNRRNQPAAKRRKLDEGELSTSRLQEEIEIKESGEKRKDEEEPTEEMTIEDEGPPKAKKRRQMDIRTLLTNNKGEPSVEKNLRQKISGPMSPSPEK